MLTTFPAHRSGNVGDALIAESFLALVRRLGLADEVETMFRADPLTDDKISEFGSTPIFMPGMSVSNDLYPKLYALHEDFDKIPNTLIPFGCTWQHTVGFPQHFERAVLDGDTLRLLHKIADATGPIATRDHSAELILTNNGIPSITVGDCAWYHLPSQGKAMKRPKEIKKIAVTTPHHSPLVKQSLDLLGVVRELFPSAKISLVTHSKPTAHEKRVVEAAPEYGASIVAAAGDLTIFDKYEDFDLHVGHRLHGHIGFLRRRIPSVLIAEDARSRGFSSSIQIGTFPGYRNSEDGPEPDPNTVPRIKAFLKQEARDRFIRYVGIPLYLDTMLNEVVLPELRRKYDYASSVK